MVNPELRRKIKVKVRPDLIITQQKHAGQTYYIVKDPVAFKYFRFREEELFLLKRFDGRNNFDDIRHEFVEKFRPQRLGVVELEKFVQQLLQAGLATADTPQLGQRMFERFKKKRMDRLKGFFSNVLNIKVSLFDPDRLLTSMLRYTGFLFTLPFFLVAVLFFLASAGLVLLNWEDFLRKLPAWSEFFTPKNILYFWLTLAAVKVIHEFGHGLSCKRFGGEVHEMGLLFLVLTPCLYANVTDSWMLPSKWHRAIIGAAGMYFEFLIAAIAVWVWWFTEPGAMINTLSLVIIFICSFSTFVFNANPLLRFDGYYIMSDLLEIPNLRERSNRLLGNMAGRFFLGVEVVEDPFMPRRNQWFFLTYAVTSWCYRWLVTFGILFFFYNLLKPYRLGTISAMLALASLIPMLVLPIRNIHRTLKNKWRSLKVNKARVVASVTATALVLGALLAVPLPMWVDVPCMLVARDAVTLYVREQGTLEELFVEDDRPVLGGEVIARLRSAELERRHKTALAEREQLALRLRAASAFGDAGWAASKAEEQAARERVGMLEEQIRQLEIRVPRNTAGRAILPPRKSDLGRTYKPGDPFCQIGDTSKLDAFLVLSHSDIGLVDVGQPVSLKMNGHLGWIVASNISRIGTDDLEELPQAMSNKHGGHVATQPSDAKSNSQQQSEQPIARSYSILVPVPETEGKWRPGMRGFARVHLPNACIAWRIYRYFHQTWNFRL
jgi:putative peptide zinc metalloprotease protein